MEARLMFQQHENRSTEDGIRIEPASNSKISMRSPSSNAIIIIIIIINGSRLRMNALGYYSVGR